MSRRPLDLTDAAFREFLRRITPSDTQYDAAQRSHAALRDFLEDDPHWGPRIATTFLNGSYARRTVINPIRDVDLIVVVEGERRGLSPEQAISSLQRKLAQRYAGGRTRRRRRAVCVTLFDMQLDVLYALRATSPTGALHIPDRRADEWLLTHPQLQRNLAEALARPTGGHYRRLVRLVKAWAGQRVAANVRPRSFVIECAVYRIVSREPTAFAGRLDDGFERVIRELAHWGLGEFSFWWGSIAADVRDPALSDVNVARGWLGEAADQFKKCLERTVREIERARRARWEETEVDHWGTIFGGRFPTSRSASLAAS